MLKEFRDFVLRGNVVDLAIAIVLGVAFAAVIASLVEGLITPLIAALVGEPDFSALAFTVNESTFRYGIVVNALISFVIVAAVIFFLVVRPLNALMERRMSELPLDESVHACPECLSDIPIGARRCAFCTAPVEPA